MNVKINALIYFHWAYVISEKPQGKQTAQEVFLLDDILHQCYTKPLPSTSSQLEPELLYIRMGNHDNILHCDLEKKKHKKTKRH